MGTENQNQGENTSGDIYVTYEVDLQNVETLLQSQEETQGEILQEIQSIRQDMVSMVGIFSALMGMLIGFFCMKELLKVWLE